MELTHTKEAYYTKLDEIDGEDLGDFLDSLQKSYGIEFGNQDFASVNTYGELCDVILGKLENCEDVKDCTNQQAFYKLRTALAITLHVSNSSIGLDTKLETLIPRNQRLSVVKRLRRNLGFKLDVLTPPTWYIIITVIVFLLSLGAFFFSGKIAISGILLTIAMWKIGSWFGKEFWHKTVGAYAREMTRKHYRDSRRNGNTVNKTEMKNILDEQMVEVFELDKASLTRDAKFSWAK